MSHSPSHSSAAILPSLEAWGVLPSFWDAGGRQRCATPAAAEAVIRAMGYDPGSPPPADEARVRVVRPGETVWLAGRGELILEDGTQLPVDGTLPPDLPLGYHQLRTGADDAAELIIKRPPACFLDPHVRAWGWAVQLYAVRSARSWGFGDLADLRDLGQWAAEVGAGGLLINPLAAVAPTVPQTASPYSPSSRRFRNPLYLCVPEIPGAAEAGADLGLAELAAAGTALNADRRIRRDHVYRLKMEALERLWPRVRDAVGRTPEFWAYCVQQEPGLEAFAAYCCLAERFGRDWRQWPAIYRHPHGAAVAELGREQDDRLQFHKWLQWQLDEQLARAAAKINIVQDLPIGVDPAGADAWEWQDVWATGATLGAPPDTFQIEGQNWALAPFVPRRLRAAHYRPFIDTLRASLRHARGLRIDHVMGLFRLYWIPAGLPNDHGLYVRYPADELLAIVALESHRAGAWIAGEDLGTVEPEVRQRLAANHMLSYRLLWFEDHRPGEYPELSMAAVTTHDLPTIAGLWTGEDYRAQQRIGLTPNAIEYDRIRSRLTAATGLPPGASPEQVCLQAHAALAQAPSAVLAANLDDALAVSERPNMPGTVHEWPNWSIALPVSLEELQTRELPRAIAKTLSQRARRCWSSHFSVPDGLCPPEDTR